jgi:drug/metabolite transporter (DMT)-like permease
MRERIARWAAVACAALVAGAGLGFLARDILGLSQPIVAAAWLLGAAAAVGAGLRAGRRTSRDRGRQRSPPQEGG